MANTGQNFAGATKTLRRKLLWDSASSSGSPSLRADGYVDCIAVEERSRIRTPKP